MFKVGDRVRVKAMQDSNSTNCGQLQSAVGIESSIIRIDGDHIYLADLHTCLPPIQLEAIRNSTGKRGRPRTKAPKVNFLLKYDLDQDPIEEFETMDQVKDRIDYLVQHERSLKKDSIVVYEVKRKKVVSIETKIIMK